MQHAAYHAESLTSEAQLVELMIIRGLWQRSVTFFRQVGSGNAEVQPVVVAYHGAHEVVVAAIVSVLAGYMAEDLRHRRNQQSDHSPRHFCI